jgi:hypothetical protein
MTFQHSNRKLLKNNYLIIINCQLNSPYLHHSSLKGAFDHRITNSNCKVYLVTQP